MQDDEIIARDDLVEQMRGPQHADALLGDKLADMGEDVGAGLDVEPDGRLVEQQKSRPMSWPNLWMRPAWSPNSRVMIENRVLFPAPLRPSRAVKLAGATVKLTSVRARRVP